MNNKSELARGNDLFSCFAQLLRLYHSPIPVEEFIKGLPVDPVHKKVELVTGEGLIDNFSRAAARAGFNSKISRKKLSDISNLMLPAILVFNDGTGCILDSLDKKKSTAGIIIPEAGDGVIEKSFARIEESYSGFMLLLSKTFDYSEREKKSVKTYEGHWLISAIRSSWPIYLDVLIASAVINIFALVSPIFTMNVYDRVVPNNATETLWVLGIGVLVVFFFDALLKFLRTWFIEIAAKKTDIIISSRLFSQVMNLKMEHSPRNVGSFASNLREFDAVRNFLTSSVVLTLVDLPFTLLLLGVVYYLGGKMVLVPIAIMVMIVLYALLIKGPLYRSVASSFDASGRKNAVTIESLSGMEDIKFLNATGSFQWKWEQVVAELAKIGIKSRLLSASMSTLTGFLMQVETVVIVIMGVYMIRDQEMTMGALIAIVMLSSRAMSPIGQLVALLSGYDQTRVAYQSTNEIMQRPSEMVSYESVKKSSIEGEIELKDVVFTYPGSDKSAVNGVSFKIKPGEKVALLGRTGSGKSTVNKLITGLYKPQSGAVFIDGIEVSQYGPANLRSNINYVSQNFTLFSGTLRENIIFKAPYADDETIIKAAYAGGLEEYIKSNSRGLDAMLQERGANLSGGQRQGVAIARAFLLDAPIVLLDEPTNSMDGTIEGTVKENLKERIGNRTLILVTHKNNLLDMVDRVIVLDEGKKCFDGAKEDFFRQFMRPVVKGQRREA